MSLNGPFKALSISEKVVLSGGEKGTCTAV